MVEKWLPVVGFDGFYEVSSHGRVRSVERTVIRSNGRSHHVAARVRALKTDPKGYRHVTLVRDNKMYSRTVHGLVLEAFIGPRPLRALACHWDRNPSNNHVENLRWGTDSDNQQDSLRHGTHAMTNRTNCKRGHPLAEPNLAPNKAGRRVCLACRREATNAFDQSRPFDPQRADARYADVIAGRRRHKSEARL